ncbi:MAG TPA: PAS domain S-box protein [Spirochaetota bacterium]|nr:PAS domain S-box protein [Spirochaetota bacterium]HOM86764.1 PAS domain S-box protein [Spirochaetota bacterium]HOT18546.1 PAS domain S-box protein [Spirochaetota bacterium]HPD03651.1 PAS domain S-box protein [Spirochaetota bacterium]HQI37580.1 PAS domain S-box protein [Spirochaetota bacterium]
MSDSHKKQKTSKHDGTSNRKKKQISSTVSGRDLQQLDFYNIIAQKSADIFTIFDMDFNIIFVSPSIEKILGFTPQEHKKRKLDQILTPDSLQSAFNVYAEEMEKEKAGNVDPDRNRIMELEHYCKDGSTRWLEVNLSMIRDAQLKPLGILAVSRDVSELKDITNQLKESEKQYRILVETAKEGIWRIDSNNVTTYVNAAMADMLGYAQKEMIGRPIFDFMFEDDIPVLKERIETRRVIGIADVYEDRRKRKDGSELWCIVSGQPIMDEKGKYIGSFAMYTDITDRKKAEEKIAEYSTMMENVIEATQTGTWQWNLQTGALIINEMWAHLLGYTLEELSPISIKTWEMLTHPDDVKKAYEDLVNHYTGEKPYYECEIRMKHKQGHWVWILTKGEVIEWTPDRQPLMIYGTHTDITHFKETEQALKESRQLLNNVINTIPVRVFWKDRNLRFLGCNKHFAVDAGFEKTEDIIGKTDYDMGWRSEAELYRMDDKEVIETGIPKIGYEESQTAPDGSNLWIRTSKIPLRLGDEIIGVLGTYEDITAKKLADEKLKESEERYRSITETTHDIIVLHDMNGIIQYVNQTGINIGGYGYDEIVGKNILKFIPKKYHQSIVTLHQERINGYMGLHQYETEIINKLKKKIPVEVASSPIVKNGKTVAILIVAHDLTQRKMAEELLVKNKERLESIIAVLQKEAKTEEELFYHVLNEAIKLTDSTIGYAMEYNEEEKRCFIKAWSDVVMNQCAIQDKPVIYNVEGAGIWVETIKQARPVVINNYNDYHPAKRGYPEGHVDIQRFLGIPVFKDNRIVATVGVANKETDYTEIDILQITMLMDSAWQKIEKIKSEQALAESEEKFRSLANSTPTAILLYQDNKWIYANPAAVNIAGYSAEEFLNMNFWDIVHPDDKQIVRERGTKRQTNVDTVDSYEFRIIAKDGRIKWVYLSGVSVIYKGRPAGMISILDITDRKMAEESLIEEKEKLRITLQSIGDGVIATDTNGRIAVINETAQQLTGYSQEEAQGKPLSEIFVIVHELSSKPLDNPVEKVLQTQQIYELSNHTMLIAKDGTRRIIADSAAPIKDAMGRILGVVLVFRDMSEKIRLIEAVQRTQRLESLGQLAAGLAHDFNNILEGVMGYIGLASTYIKDNNISELLGEALKSVQRAKGLTGQLLTFAKGGTPIKKTQSVIPLLKDTVKFALSGSNVKAEFNCDEDLWNAEFDYNQIAQVIENIVINAVHAMPMGGTITVGAHNITFALNEHPLLPAGKYIKIAIADKGIGIPKDILSKIFDPFFTTKSKGHGLGLATGYSIIARHNGTIEVDSIPGQGTTFYIYLPATQQKVEMEEKNKTYEKKLTGGKILVLDDDAMMQKLMISFLEHLGFEAMAVEDGQSAVNLFLHEKEKGTPFNALIFDLTVKGGMGGTEAIQLIRQHDTGVPAFVMSGYHDDQVLANPEEYGFNNGLSKPFTIEELQHLLAKYF